MSLPYSTPPHAWRFVLILHKLASLDNQPLRITPAGKSSIYTARAKLFQGRSYILATHDPALARYSPLALGRGEIHIGAIGEAEGFCELRKFGHDGPVDIGEGIGEEVGIGGVEVK